MHEISNKISVSSKAAKSGDCKSPPFGVHRFESCLADQIGVEVLSVSADLVQLI